MFFFVKKQCHCVNITQFITYSEIVSFPACTVYCRFSTAINYLLISDLEYLLRSFFFQSLKNYIIISLFY